MSDVGADDLVGSALMCNAVALRVPARGPFLYCPI